MAERIQKKTPTKQKPVEESPQASERVNAEELKKKMDDLLDEVDEVLEENASDFVRQYVQKGGE